MTIKKNISAALRAFVVIFSLLMQVNSYAQDSLKAAYLQEAKLLVPTLTHKKSFPVRSISLKKDLKAWLGWKAVTVLPATQLTQFKLVKGDTLLLDFGRNMVGYLQGIADANASVQFEPAEVLAELGDAWEQYPALFDNGYKPIKTWSPFVLSVNKNWRLNERLTFRYIRLIVLEATTGIRISGLHCDEVSAVPFQKIKSLQGFSKKMQQIDNVAQHTLRNCIQEVFEDGPKRDRRLWLGDLRLEALPDGLIFKSDAVVKRCLLLFAGMQRKDGFIASCVYTPTGRNPEIGDEMIPDYAMLLGSTLLQYANNSGDWALAKKLYPLASQQVELVCNKWLNDKNYLEIPDSIWQFIDWSRNLNRQTSEQATAIYALRVLEMLASKLDNKKDKLKWETLRNKLQASSMKYLFDADKGLFVSGKQRQVSWASQVWMILAGVVDKNTGAKMLTRIQADTGAIKPGTPYLVHHLVEAYLLCGMDKAAYKLIASYWGGMVDKGADTFWEIYDPANAYTSPYNSHLFNSYCHAWSCTPSWFLRHPVYAKRLQKIDLQNTQKKYQ